MRYRTHVRVKNICTVPHCEFEDAVEGVKDVLRGHAEVMEDVEEVGRDVIVTAVFNSADLWDVGEEVNAALNGVGWDAEVAKPVPVVPPGKPVSRDAV